MYRVPAEVDDAKKGAEIVRKCLRQLGAVAASLGELRNLYGSGHGRDGKWKGLGPRHARLAVGAGITVAEFIAETYLERKGRAVAVEGQK
jgi:Abortive infection C-terminus